MAFAAPDRDLSSLIRRMTVSERYSTVSAAGIRELKDELKSAKRPRNVKYTTEDQYRKKIDMQKCYSMKNSPRGRALVITMTGNCVGWDEDVRALHQMFLYLDIKVEYSFDLGSQEVMQKLKQFASDPENKTVDVLFVIMTGHGTKIQNEEYLVTADGGSFLVQAGFRKIFSNADHPHLIDKPKVFLVDMCRGGETMSAVQAGEEELARYAHMQRKRDERHVPQFSDYLIGWATRPGHVAWMASDGSRYVQEIASVFLKHAADLDVESMLKEVNRIFEKKSAKNVQGGEYVAGLKNSLYLFPGYPKTVPKPLTEEYTQKIHPFVICRACDRPVVGIRYKCRQCPNYSLCEKCEKKGRHKKHELLKIRKPVDATEEWLDFIKMMKEEEMGENCSVCERHISEARFKCATCPNFFLCENCEEKGKHDQHALVKMRYESDSDDDDDDDDDEDEPSSLFDKV